MHGANNHEEGAAEPMIEHSNQNHLDEQPQTRSRKVLCWVRQNVLLIMTVLAVLLGVLVGFSVRLAKPSQDVIFLISFPGQILLRMLKMVIIPLIVSSLISGLAQLNPKSSGKMGSKTLIYYAATTVLAVILGIILVISIHPGNREVKAAANASKTDVSEGRISTLDAVLDLIRNLFPENLISACFRQSRTRYKDVPIENLSFRNHTGQNDTANMTVFYTTPIALIYNSSNETANVSAPPTTRTVRVVTEIEGMNVLGLICFCIGFGVILSQMQDRAQHVIQFFMELSEIIMKIVGVLMWYSPIGILFLVTGNILAIPDLALVASTLGLYMLTVMVGLIIHGLGTLPLIYFIVCRKNPYRFLKGMLQAFLTALGTASSSATLPVTFRCLEENNGIDKRVTRFVLPVGATVNMDGTALYEAVAAIFIAQLNGIPLSFGDIVTISMTATLASVGAASIPSAGLVTMVMVLLASGLPPEDIGIIFSVDWFLDRFRTSVNVLGDAFGAGIVQHLSREDLAREDEELNQDQLTAVLVREEPDDLNDNSKHTNSYNLTTRV